jgi:hypothetical protein
MLLQIRLRFIFQNEFLCVCLFQMHRFRHHKLWYWPFEKIELSICNFPKKKSRYSHVNNVKLYECTKLNYKFLCSRLHKYEKSNKFSSFYAPFTPPKSTHLLFLFSFKYSEFRFIFCTLVDVIFIHVWKKIRTMFWDFQIPFFFFFEKKRSLEHGSHLDVLS